MITIGDQDERDFRDKVEIAPSLMYQVPITVLRQALQFLDWREEGNNGTLLRTRTVLTDTPMRQGTMNIWLTIRCQRVYRKTYVRQVG